MDQDRQNGLDDAPALPPDPGLAARGASLTREDGAPASRAERHTAGGVAGWVIVVDRPGDLRPGNGNGAGRTVVTTRDFISKPEAFKGRETKVINLSRSLAYLGAGYYCSLLAEARGLRVMPTVSTILELAQKSLYGHALPDLEDELNRRVKRLHQRPEGPFKLLVCFGHCDDHRFQAFGRRLFDQFRCPVIEVKVRFGEWLQIAAVRPVALSDLTAEQLDLFGSALDQYTRRTWRHPKPKVQAKYTLAVLHNPKEQLPPSKSSSLQRLERVAESLGVEVELIEKKDFLRLAEFDALLIRETTAIDNHTYRFAKRAEQEGMPVIDSTSSMLRCANKVYLAELLKANKIPTPKTLVVEGIKQVEKLEAELPYPIVLKIPDGSFSRGVFKAKDRRELIQTVEALLDDSDLILAQEFMPTEFDWRVGVLDGEPLFVCQYLMARKHWQIVKHNAGARPVEGRFRTYAVEDAPAEVVQTGVAAARLIGDGFYGVDLKQTDRGVFVIEINDNPNLDHGVEDSVGRDEVWRKLVRWFLKRLD